MITIKLNGFRNCLRATTSLFLLIALITTLTALAPAQASDPAGTWVSTTGSTIQIWANMQQLVITVTSPKGASYKYQGWWTRFGETFAYQVPGAGNYSCGIYNNGNNIQVFDPKGGKYIWTRWTGNNATTAPTYNPNQNNPMHGSYYTQSAYNNSKAQPVSTININGLWRSTSGSSVQLSSQGVQVFVVVITPQGQRYEGSGRWLVTNSQFDYSIPGAGGAAICTINPQNWNQITVLKDGKYTYWSR